MVRSYSLTKSDKPEIIKSFYYNQHDIIRGITKLHLGGRRIHLDPTYGYGQFYKPNDISEPTLAYDVNSELDSRVTHRTIYTYDASDLSHLENNSIESIMFDPPFLRTTGRGSILKDRFGSYPTMKLLWKFYAEAMWEFCRVLMPGGVLIVKMQNTVMSGRQWWSVRYINDLASKYKLDALDEFILGASHRLPQHNLKQQRHARKFHSFFNVYKKGK